MSDAFKAMIITRSPDRTRMGQILFEAERWKSAGRLKYNYPRLDDFELPIIPLDSGFNALLDTCRSYASSHITEIYQYWVIDHNMVFLTLSGDLFYCMQVYDHDQEGAPGYYRFQHLGRYVDHA